MPLAKMKVAFRGDNRPPHEIFPFGFRRWQDTWGFFEEKWQSYLERTFDELLGGSDSDSDSDDEADPFLDNFGFKPDPGAQPLYPNFRFRDTDPRVTVYVKDTVGLSRPITIVLDKSPATLYGEWMTEVNKGFTLRSQADIDPKSAICITPKLNVAALFPFPPEYPKWGRDSTWVYVVYVDGVFVTWQHQIDLNTSISKVLARSREIASRDIPSGHVFAAVRVYRRWTKKVKRGRIWKADWRSGVSFVVSPYFEMNTKLANQENYARIEGWVRELLGPYLGKSFPCETFEGLPDGVLG